MCTPIAFAAASMVIAAAGTAANLYQQNKMQEQAEKAAQKSARLAEEAEKNQLEALNAQIEQETDKAEIEKLERERQALRERAMIRVSSSESGAFGNVVLKQLSASMVQEGQDTGMIEHNLGSTLEQIERRKEAVKINTRTRKANAFAGVPPGMSGLMAGLNIGLSAGQGAMSGYGMGQSFESPTPGTPYIPIE